MDDDQTKYGSRKFILAAVLMLSGIALLTFSKISQETFQTIELSALAMYITGNVAQKFTIESVAK